MSVASFLCDYVLESEVSRRLYTGQTNNLKDRLNRHNANRNKSTKK
ncbi:MAG: GIY-YIG nuclease family protein [Flavobacteriales bacterium]|nr:GIY-YIG nuclease family protein [Flavobacteriales bacterium]